MKTPIRIAIIGLGRAGWFLHFEPLLQDSCFQIVAVSDPDSARVQEAEEKSGCRGYATPESMLAGEALDLVVIATPNLLHAGHARLALQAGCHCVIEKPMASSYEEAEAVAAEAEERQRKLFVHHQHIFRNEYTHFREICEAGILGDIFHVQCLWANYNRRWDWQTLRRNGGGQLNNTCPHALSIVLPLLGSSVQRVYADLRNIKDAGDCEDHVHLVIETESGVTADITVTSASAVPGTKWMLMGRHGALQSDGQQSRLRYFDPTGLPGLEVVDGAAPARNYLTEVLPWQEEVRDTKPRQSSPSFYQNVADVLLDNQPMLVTLESALEVTRVIDMAHQSTIKRMPIFAKKGLTHA